MTSMHLVRVGIMGQVGRFASANSVRYRRGNRVVVRTVRGLELGTILGHAGGPSLDNLEPTTLSADAFSGDGSILRRMTVEDELLATRLESRRQEALLACEVRLQALGLPNTLLDVEHLFGGESLVFYFMGAPSAELDDVTHELAEIYDAAAAISQFAHTLEHGCGTGCGTEEKSGQGCSSCQTGCGLAAACHPRG